MGTNYYAIPKVDDQLARRFAELAVKQDWSALKYEMSRLPEIHIGKSSSGWKFTFDHNNWEYFNQNKQAVVDFINTCFLRDEYGTEITHADFWEMVEAKKDGLDTAAYYRKYPDHYNPIFGSKDHDLYVDDLLFHSQTDFS